MGQNQMCLHNKRKTFEQFNGVSDFFYWFIDETICFSRVNSTTLNSIMVLSVNAYLQFNKILVVLCKCNLSDHKCWLHNANKNKRLDFSMVFNGAFCFNRTRTSEKKSSNAFTLLWIMKREKNVTIFPFECIGSCVKMDWKVK